MLELDAGFAGGVCRCSNCGTLMTVPSSAGKAESLTKPTSSASAGSGGMSSMGVADRTSRRSGPAGKAKKGRSAKGRSIGTTIEAGEYRTASGKVVRVDESMRVPMAERKKKQIRVATTAVFFSIVAAVVAVAVVAIVFITGGSGGPGGGSGDISYDPAANPYELPFANVMGLPVTDRTAVVVEASAYSADWAAFVGDMVGAGLSRDSAGGEIALIGAGAQPVPFGRGSPGSLPIEADKVRGWFEKLPADAESDVAAAIEAALEQDPATLIVVHGYVDASDVVSWDALLEGKDDLKLHVVHIGNSSPELEGWASERGGEAVVLSIDQIEILKEMAGQASTQE